MTCTVNHLLIELGVSRRKKGRAIMAKYQKSHHEDVARILATHTDQGFTNAQYYGASTAKNIALALADLFAADNPKCCTHCGYIEGATEICDSANGQLRDEHLFEGGFDREGFLTACGLK